MYRVYVLKQRSGGSEVISETRTSTPSIEAAHAAFRALRAESLGADHILLLTRDKRQLAAHRFQSAPGDRDHTPLDAQLPE